jgi:hypothetical protein
MHVATMDRKTRSLQKYRSQFNNGIRTFSLRMQLHDSFRVSLNKYVQAGPQMGRGQQGHLAQALGLGGGGSPQVYSYFILKILISKNMGIPFN